ncbi:hypothetical protein [Frisingicoccus sp.]|uniref:hypothetical protein n=1 Tax=Frisingicoccus sp. TaxID=1918627 RepID=UPI003FA6018A
MTFFNERCVHVSWFFSYILSYGQYARVLSPSDVRDVMSHTIKTMAGNDGAGSGD